MPAHLPGRPASWRIIATDDDVRKLSVIIQTLRDAGHYVFAAYDAQSALELVIQLPFIDLLVTNTRIGPVDCLELMRRSREVRPGLPILHVIHTGDADPGMPPDVLTLREPFTPEELLVAVQRLVR